MRQYWWRWSPCVLLENMVSLKIFKPRLIWIFAAKIALERFAFWKHKITPPPYLRLDWPPYPYNFKNFFPYAYVRCNITEINHDTESCTISYSFGSIPTIYGDTHIFKPFSFYHEWVYRQLISIRIKVKPIDDTSLLAGFVHLLQ